MTPFVEDWNRVLAGGELEWRLPRRNRVAVGMRYEDLSRDVVFARSGRRIHPDNALVAGATETVTVYGRGVLRPWRGFTVTSDFGYRGSPQTGYITDLENDFYGEVRATHVVPLQRPVVLSAYARGNTGDNDDFRLVPARGDTQTGPSRGAPTSAGTSRSA